MGLGTSSTSCLYIEIATPQVLSHYNVEADTKISAGASSYVLGDVLLQLNDGK